MADTREPMTSSPITDEKLNGLWLHRHDFTEAEWAEIAPILLGTLVAMRSSAPPVMEMEEMVRWREGGTIFDALCRVRCRNAADFSGKLTARESEVYDKAVLACFAEIEKALSTPLVTGRE
jgi:hypothetical protein